MNVVRGPSPRRPALVPPLAFAFFLVICLQPAWTSAGQAPGPLAPAVSAPLATFDAAWAAIRETYVDRSRSEADWARLHREFRGRAAGVSTDEELRPILRELLSAIGRSHFELLPSAAHERLSPGGLSDAGDLGLAVTPIEDELIVTRVDPAGPAYAAGIRPGWAVESVDGMRGADLGGGSGLKGDSARAFRLWAGATALLRGPVGSLASLRLRDGSNAVVAVDVKRIAQTGQPVKFGHLPTLFARLDDRTLAAPGGRRVQYIHFNIWMPAVSPALDRAIASARDADGVVLDLRQNPGGVLTMLMGVSGHFLDQPISLGTVRTRESELKLVANPRLVALDGTPARPYRGRLAILVDESSYSASEIFAAGMQSIRRARVFGSRSPGGALPAMLRRLPSGDVLEYAIGDFVTATGEHIEGRGVVPDELVQLTRGAVLEGSDPPLAAALAWIGRE